MLVYIQIGFSLIQGTPLQSPLSLFGFEADILHFTAGICLLDAQT